MGVHWLTRPGNAITSHMWTCVLATLARYMSDRAVDHSMSTAASMYHKVYIVQVYPDKSKSADLLANLRKIEQILGSSFAYDRSSAPMWAGVSSRFIYLWWRTSSSHNVILDSRKSNLVTQSLAQSSCLGFSFYWYFIILTFLTFIKSKVDRISSSAN